jgi:hypothetical protein
MEDKKDIQSLLDQAAINLGKINETINFLKENEEVAAEVLDQNPKLAYELGASSDKLNVELEKLHENLDKINATKKWYLVYEQDASGLDIDINYNILLETNDEEEAKKVAKKWDSERPFSFQDGGPMCYTYEFHNEEDFINFRDSLKS